MRTRLLVLIPVAALCAAPLLIATAPQKRASEKKVASFEEHIQEASRAWSAQQFGSVTRSLSAALTQAKAMHRELLLAALPNPGDDWELVKPRKSAQNDAALAKMLGASSALVPLERQYKHSTSGTVLKYHLSPDSPMVPMMGIAMNPAMMEEGLELIEYNSDKAVLKNKGSVSELTVILDSKHLLQATVRNQDPDFLLDVISQAAVDQIKLAINH